MMQEPLEESGAKFQAPNQGSHRYLLRQNLIALGDDYWIENEKGEQVYQIDGKALRLRKTLLFKDHSGQELCRILEKMIAIRKSMYIEGPDGRLLATVTKAMIRLLREHFTVSIEGQPEIEIQGNALDHEYKFEQQGHTIAETSKKWFRVADSYGVEIEPGQDHLLILAVTVAVDMLAHRGR
jgi:uncharacterized protein YxjI